ncbi:MAG: alpha/beta hydrolase [Rhodocyclaceae bacterium]|jgi:pimeloyl-ACP methyl ester carboxylesterase|nr:alpha/beta hydrolase [Rhodocyclaceae bacterium]
MFKKLLSRRSALGGLFVVGACKSIGSEIPKERSLVKGRNGDIEVLSVGIKYAPSIVLLPSLGRGASDFGLLADAIARAGFQAVCPEPRGFGKSEPYRAEVTLSDLADDVIDLIESRPRGGPVIVLGHAFGNRVARMTAALRPDLVEAVILLAAGGKVAMAPDIEQSLLASFDLSLPDAERMNHVSRAFFAPGNEPTAWRYGWRRDVAEAQINATQRTPVDKWWNAGRASILVVQPLQDVLAPPENIDALRAAAPGRIQVIQIDRAGHALLPEQPDAVAQAVIEFAKYLQAQKQSKFQH